MGDSQVFAFLLDVAEEGQDEETEDNEEEVEEEDGKNRTPTLWVPE